uniref:Uncharacterized protein n=1 Tax=Brassica campestris TaxID=3711 RepID=A0A3P6BBE8_BRACM|nr:unnamed protein product [Brassica rapa]
MQLGFLGIGAYLFELGLRAFGKSQSFSVVIEKSETLGQCRPPTESSGQFLFPPVTSCSRNRCQSR